MLHVAVNAAPPLAPEQAAYPGAFVDRHTRVPYTAVVEWGDDVLPMLTIAIPTFRRAELLGQALRSAASQDVALPFEVMVIDNDPEGDDVAVRAALEDPALRRVQHMRYLRNAENTGMFGNWNRCVALARGAWLTILNDDDLLDVGFLREAIAVVAARPGAALVAARSRVLDERVDNGSNLQQRLTERVRARRATKVEGRIDRLGARDYFLNNPHQGSLGILFRRDAAMALDGFAVDAYPSADYFLFATFQQRYPAYLLHRTLSSYRVLANESRNAVVAERWVAQGLELRRNLAGQLSAPRWLLELYSRLLAIHTARYCKAYWKSDLDVAVTLRRHGLPNLPVHTLLLLLRALLRRTFLRGRHDADATRTLV